MDFTLDLSKWRAGDCGANQVGYGPTKLLNHEGYMCCLGQFQQQLGVREADMGGMACPETLYSYFGGGSPEVFPAPSENIFIHYYEDMCDYSNTPLAASAIIINDDLTLTTDERIDQLQTLFEEHGHTITVTGVPHTA